MDLGSKTSQTWKERYGKMGERAWREDDNGEGNMGQGQYFIFIHALPFS